MRVAVARNIFVARGATEKLEAVGRQAQIHERLLSLSRGSQSRPGSHILGYADTPEAHSLIGTAEEITDGLAVLKDAGVAYVLLFGQGSRDNLRRFAERVCLGRLAKRAGWCTREDLNLHALRRPLLRRLRLPFRHECSDGFEWRVVLAKDSNLPPLAYEASALPDELSQLENGQRGCGAAPGVEATLWVRRARRRVQIWTFTMSKSDGA